MPVPSGDLSGPDARRLRVRRRGGRRRLPPRPRGDSPVFLALPPGGQGEHPRLRRARPLQAQRRAGRRRGARPALPGAGRRGPRPDPRHRPQPHEHRQPGQPLVVGRPRERPVEPLRQLLRRRLAAARGEAPRHRADADPGRPLRPRGRRRPRPAPTRRRDLHVPLLRPRHAGRPPVAQRPPQRGRPPGRLGRPGVPGRLVRQPADRLDHRPPRASPAATATRRSSGPPWTAWSPQTPRSPPRSTARSAEINASPTRVDALLERQNYRLASGRPPSRSWIIAGSSTSTP